MQLVEARVGRGKTLTSHWWDGEQREVAKELFALKGLKKGEKEAKTPSGTYCSPEFGMEPRHP